ncbi:hypothetical protein LWI28_011590 [Acer negundo]|uniref:Uncharacterized protein n=1 Tax=Acer negundo TaxID=4023 RepID=A0AAD5NGC2_ACENE|nr:hypothetical protein LWI28_011590 [Acer negundo]
MENEGDNNSPRRGGEARVPPKRTRELPIVSFSFKIFNTFFNQINFSSLWKSSKNREAYKAKDWIISFVGNCSYLDLLTDS